MKCIVCGNAHLKEFLKKDAHSFKRCTECGLETILPQPGDEELSQIYNRHYYEAWGMHDNESLVAELKHSTFRKLLALTDKYIPDNARILDLGCATGYFLDICKLSGYEPFGVELSEYGAEEAASKHGKEHIFCGRFEDAQFKINPENTFAAIFMSDFLEHVRDPGEILQRAYMLLDPGGLLIVTTPYVGSLSYYLMGKTWSQYKQEHLFYFSPGNIKRLLRAAGFREVKRKPAYKSMNLRYLAWQFLKYRHPIISPLFAALTKIMPSFLLNIRFPALLGDMTIVAKK
jgi:SAM-dependent methyltransferase